MILSASGNWAVKLSIRRWRTMDKSMTTLTEPTTKPTPAAIHRWGRNGDNAKVTPAHSDAVHNPSAATEILKPVWARNSFRATNLG